jgi:ubiquinone/menaquinone biosynthesis C-methylase UbiE
MKAVRDPEGVEVSTLLAACPLAGRQLLEIGCGKGTLTWQVASLPRQVVGIDQDAAVLEQAHTARPAGVTNVSLLRAAAEALPFRSEVFDLAVFASSF